MSTNLPGIFALGEVQKSGPILVDMGLFCNNAWEKKRQGLFMYTI